MDRVRDDVRFLFRGRVPELGAGVHSGHWIHGELVTQHGVTCIHNEIYREDDGFVSSIFKRVEPETVELTPFPMTIDDGDVCCPSCGRIYDPYEMVWMAEYCHECGQRLDWHKVEQIERAGDE